MNAHLSRFGTASAHSALRLGALLASLLMATSASAVDWSAVKERELTLLYPGQASWEWVMTQADHSGAGKFRAGKNCRGCHDGEQADIGKEIMSGEHALEPSPIAGKPGSAKLFVKTAHDAERLYFHLRWHPAAASGKHMAKDAAHITVMLDDGGTRESVRAGCWASCHDDAIGMASAPADSKISKYLGGSRAKLSRQGGGENFKPAGELQAQLSQGAFLEYWQARLNPGQPATPVSGYILDRRQSHEPVAISAEATFANGEWQVTLSRPLKASGAGQKNLVAGKTYAVGFALHDDYAEHRYHFVSLEYTLQLDGGSTDFVAAAR